MVLRVKRAVRRWSRPEEFALSGAETEASWQRMIDRLRPPPSDTERRMAEIERELTDWGWTSAKFPGNRPLRPPSALRFQSQLAKVAARICWVFAAAGPSGVA